MNWNKIYFIIVNNNDAFVNLYILYLNNCIIIILIIFYVYF